MSINRAKACARQAHGDKKGMVDYEEKEKWSKNL